MQNVLDSLLKISQLRGDDKISYLQHRLLESPKFRKVVQLALDTSKTFGTKKVEYDPNLSGQFDVLEVLEEMTKIRGNATKMQKTKLNQSSSCDPATFEITKKILRGNLDCGVGAKTISEILPGLLPWFPYMRCKGVNDIGKFDTGEFFYSQLKDNGLYVDIIVNKENETVTYRTRNGNVLRLSLPIDNKLLEPSGPSYVLGGEMTLMSENGLFLMPRAAGNAILTEAIHEGLPKEVINRIRIKLWDMVPNTAHKNGVYRIPYSERLSSLRALTSITEVTPWIEAIETKTCYTLDDAWAHYHEIRNRAVAVGEAQLEGTVIKQNNGIWKDSDSGVSWQIKLKAEKECELIVTDWKPGKPGSKYANMIGSLKLESSCGKLVTYASGMDDEVRGRDPDSLIGEIWTVCFNALSSNKNKETVAMDHPRLIEPRPDKEVADDLEYIKNVKTVRKK